MSSAKLSPTATTEFLNELETSEALPKDTWYFIAAAALCVLNRPEEVALVFKHAVDNCSDTKDQLRVARRIREALIKSGAVGGLPKVIQTLLVLKRHTPAYLLDDAGLSTSRSRDFVETPPEEVFARGRAFWNAVYGQNADKLMHILNSCGTPDLGAAARMGYSFFLSHTDILTASETMFVTVSGAIVTDVQDVLLNHMKGAVNHGATVEEVRAVREMVMSICQRVWKRTGSGGWAGEVAKL